MGIFVFEATRSVLFAYPPRAQCAGRRETRAPTSFIFFFFCNSNVDCDVDVTARRSLSSYCPPTSVRNVVPDMANGRAAAGARRATRRRVSQRRLSRHPPPRTQYHPSARA